MDLIAMRLRGVNAQQIVSARGALVQAGLLQVMTEMLKRHALSKGNVQAAAPPTIIARRARVSGRTQGRGVQWQHG